MNFVERPPHDSPFPFKKGACPKGEGEKNNAMMFIIDVFISTWLDF